MVFSYAEARQKICKRLFFAFTTDKEKFAIEKVLQQGFALNIHRILNRSGR